MSEALFKEDHPLRAKALFNLGQCLRSQGKTEEASLNLKLSLEMRKRIFTPNHPDIASSLDGIGLSLLIQGKPQEAKEYIN